jgi:aminomethyltransferase
MKDMKKTALYDKHIALGAKMMPFAGYEMPVRYSSEIEEHHAVRKDVGLFDVSHMGEFLLRGHRALALVQKVTSNDASKLEVGQAQYSCLPNENSGIVDDLLVYRLKEHEYMLVVNASNIQKDWIGSLGGTMRGWKWKTSQTRFHCWQCKALVQSMCSNR